MMPEDQPGYTPGIEAEKRCGIEAEQTPEDLGHFDVAVILGAGTRPDSEGGMTKLSIDSKLRTISAGILATLGRVNELILTGGKTAGAKNPSEAELMKQYLLKKFPDLDGFPVATEDSSMNTAESAEIISNMLASNPDMKILLVTNQYHLARANDDFHHHGVPSEGQSAESIIIDESKPRYNSKGKLISDHREEFIQKYLSSCDIKKKQAIEVVLQAIMKIDPGGKMLTALAHVLRHGNEINEES